MADKQFSISVIIPSYNEEQSIGKVVKQVVSVMDSLKSEYEIIVIDDGSEDQTKKIALEQGARVVSHPYNIGNGASIKTGIRESKGDVIVIIDGDGQHSPEDIPKLLEHYPDYQLIVGARNRETESAFHRNVANRLYNILASYVVNKRVEDLTSGFRAIDANLAKRILYLLPNGFSAPSTSTIAAFRSGYAVKYVPVRMNARVGKSKINLLLDGIRFLLIILRIGVFFSPSKIFIPLSALLFIPGLFYAIYRLIIGLPWTIPIMFSLTGGLIVLTIGLISEQIALLRMAQTE